MKRGKPVDIINAYSACAKRLRRDLSTDVPSTREAVKLLKDVTSLCFDKTERPEAENPLGRMRHRGGNDESDDDLIDLDDSSEQPSSIATPFYDSERDESYESEDNRSSYRSEHSRSDAGSSISDDVSLSYSELSYDSFSPYSDEDHNH